MGAPVKVNSSNTRPVTSVLVKKAGDPNVEREQLNRILKSLSTTVGGARGETGEAGARGSTGRTGASGSDATGVGMALLLGGM